jgi:hypothetical protein
MLVIVGARAQTLVVENGPSAYYPPACGIFAMLVALLP